MEPDWRSEGDRLECKRRMARGVEGPVRQKLEDS